MAKPVEVAEVWKMTAGEFTVTEKPDLAKPGRT
jgi:hypothetical protein